MTDPDAPASSQALAPDPAPQASPEPRRESGLPGWDAVKLIYILYLVGYFVPLCALAGLIVAYARRGEVGPAESSHLTFQIRSFWIGLAAMILGGLLTLVLLGWAVLALWAIWSLARFVTGLLKALDARAVDQPEGWSFSA